MIPIRSASDVVVVGAGPAGTVAAICLAQAGRRVTLVDRARFPRDKPCGDLVGSYAIALLARLNVDLDIIRRTAPLCGAYVCDPAGRTLGAMLNPSAANRLGARVIPRLHFDAALLDVARRAGVTVFEATPVTGVFRTPDGTIGGVQLADDVTVTAPITIGADGWSSIVARAIEPGRRSLGSTAVAIRAYVADAGENRAMRFYVGAPGDGYGWVFPLADGSANVGLGFIRGEPGTQRLQAAFTRFLDRTGFRGRIDVRTRRAWPIPLGWRGSPVSAPGALLVGDAASLASPLSGSGIHTAIASGALAAKTAVEALHAGDFGARILRRYDRRLAGLARRLQFEGVLHDLVGTPQGSRRAIALARRIPGTGRISVGWLLNLG